MDQKAIQTAVRTARKGRRALEQAQLWADALADHLRRAGYPETGPWSAADVAEDIVFNRTEHPEALLAVAEARRKREG